MVQEWLEKGIFLYVMAGICGVSILSRLILSWYLGRLLYSTANMQRAVGGWPLRVMREYDEMVESCGQVNDVDIFVDKCVGAKKMAGIMLSTWDKFGGQTMLLCGGVLLVAGGSGIFYQIDKEIVLFTIFIGIWMVILNLIADNLANLPEKKEQIKRNLKHYFENRMPEKIEKELDGDQFDEEDYIEEREEIEPAGGFWEGGISTRTDSKEAVEYPMNGVIQENGIREEPAGAQDAQAAAASAGRKSSQALDSAADGVQNPKDKPEANNSMTSMENGGAGRRSDISGVESMEGMTGDAAQGLAVSGMESTSGAGKTTSDKIVRFQEKVGKGSTADITQADKTPSGDAAGQVTAVDGKARRAKKEGKKTSAAQKKRERIKQQLLEEMAESGHDRDEENSLPLQAADIGGINDMEKAVKEENGAAAQEEKAVRIRENQTLQMDKENIGELDGKEGWGVQAKVSDDNTKQAGQERTVGTKPVREAKQATDARRAVEIWQAEQARRAQEADRAMQDNSAGQIDQKGKPDYRTRESAENSTEQVAAASDRAEKKPMTIEEAAAFLASEMNKNRDNNQLIEEVLKEFLL